MNVLKCAAAGVAYAAAFAVVVYLILAFPYFFVNSPHRNALGKLPSYGEYQTSGR